MDSSVNAVEYEFLMRAPNRKQHVDEVSADRLGAVGRITGRVIWDVDEVTSKELMDEVGVTGFVEVEPMDVDTRQTSPPQPTQSAYSVLAWRNKNNLADGCGVCGVTDTDAVVLSSLSSLSHSLSSHDPYFNLSDEILLNIFSYLPKSMLTHCARVSRRWNRVCCDESLWRRVDGADRIFKSGTLGVILDRGCMALRLSNSEIHSPIYNPTSGISPLICRLQYLDLSMAVISVDGLEKLLSHCTLLVKLSLEHCQLNEAICRHIGQNKNLRVLNVALCEGISENGLVPICNHLLKLQELNISWTNMSRGAVVYLVTCLPASIIRLNISGNRESLTDEDIQQLCNSCCDLRELDVSDARQITALSVSYIVDSLKQLEYLALSRCYNILPSSLLALVDLPKLRAFDMFGMLKETALTWLREILPTVKHINDFPLSSIARPCASGPIVSSHIWGVRV